MDLLVQMRNAAGPRQTVGLADEHVARFLTKDSHLAMAILEAHKIWKTLDPKSTYLRDEQELCIEIVNGFCHLYPEDTRNPYVPLAARGPWLVTLHGAVLHDSGGYGMLGLGHSPEVVLEAMSKAQVMANIMTPSLYQREFIAALRGEIGHNRANGCPYDSFIMINSGSEANSVAGRLIDIAAGNKANGREVKTLSMIGCFHGRTEKPASWTDSTVAGYTRAKARSIVNEIERVGLKCEVNNVPALEEVFKQAKAKNQFIEAVVLESIMGEGNPGVPVTPEFFKRARELTLEHDAMLLVDNVQAGLRCTGNLSIVDYPGFENLPAPDLEVFSKALNAGQFPVSCVAIGERAREFYRHGTYGNTMTGNPRACAVSAAVLRSITPALRENIVNMGKYAVEQYKKLQAAYPQHITNVTGTGLLYAVQLNPEIFSVVALDGAETLLRQNGIGVIHGGENALRFTPHFAITKDELDLQIAHVKAFLDRAPTRELSRLEKDRASVRLFDNDPLPASITISGHIFDTLVLNNVLDVIEKEGAHARMLRLKIGRDAADKSEVTLQVMSERKNESAVVQSVLELLKTKKDCEVVTNTGGHYGSTHFIPSRL